MTTTSNQGAGRRSSGSTPGAAGAGAQTESTKDKLKEDAQEVKREATSRAREQAEAGQHKVADEVDALSDAIDAAASNLDDQDREGLARYARQLSSNLASAAGQLEGRSVDELAKDAKRLARDNPALFMLGSIAVGFGLSRFFKSSAEHDHKSGNNAGDNAERTDAYRTDANFDDDDTSTVPPVRRREPGIPATYAASGSTGSSDGRGMS